MDDCDFGARGGSSDCTIDVGSLNTTVVLEETCEAAGGILYVLDTTYSCSALVNDTEITKTGGIINWGLCYATSCTLAEFQAAAEEAEEAAEDIPAEIDQTLFNCTNDFSVESGASS